jgi:hypothetical protein
METTVGQELYRESPGRLLSDDDDFNGESAFQPRNNKAQPAARVDRRVGDRSNKVAV